MIKSTMKILFAVTLAIGVGLASMATALAETVNVSIIVASDMSTMSGKKRGGVARLAAVVNAERAKGGNTLFVYPGDLLSPSVLGGFDKGAHMIDLLNMAPPDILVPGNHEYDFGPDEFIKRMNEGKFMKLATNTRYKDGSELPGFEDSVIKEYGGIKIGFMGLTTEDTPDISSPGNITFASNIDTARSTGGAMREAGADMVVAVVHTAQKMDFDLLYKAGVDVVLSGHDHNLHVFYDGRKALVESKEKAEYVTIMDVEFDIGESRGKRRVRWWPNFRIIDTATVTPDPKVAEKVAGYEAVLSKELDIAIGTADVEFDTRKAIVRTSEAAFGNLTADAMRAAVGADVAFTNGGGIRGNKVYDVGHTITRRDVLTELPFGNVNVKLEVTGAIIAQALEHGYRAAPDTTGSFLHISGMKVVVDTSKPAGSRVTSVMVGDAPLDPAKTYTLATNDFMGRGGDGYKMLRGAKVLIDPMSAKLMANDVMVHVRKLGAVKTGVDGRLTLN
jgi:2',3'-cyclic-nucleotide 2'-phosphodiesterase (5'-nucleotidase family)